MPVFGGVGVTSGLTPLGTNRVTLEPGQAMQLPPGAGWGLAGKYTTLQQYDPITEIWYKPGGGPVTGGGFYTWTSQGAYRLVNQSGCVVGASVTNVGSGYTSAPTVTAAHGGAKFQAVVGGAVSQTVTVTNGGSNYTYPPLVVFSAPPDGGIQATGYATLSGGAVSAVTMVDQGGGYNTAPTISFINDPRENYSWNTYGYGAAATATLTGSGTIVGIVVLDHGTPLTAVPTLTISGGGGSSAAATAIMCWGITAYAVTGGGTGFTLPMISGLDAFPTANTTVLNPAIQSNLVATRQAVILGAEGSGVITATGQVVYDGGIYTSVPTIMVTTGGTLITGSASLTATCGGFNDDSYIMQQ